MSTHVQKHKGELKTADNIDTPVQEGGVLAKNDLEIQNVVEHCDADEMLNTHRYTQLQLQ